MSITHRAVVDPSPEPTPEPTPVVEIYERPNLDSAPAAEPGPIVDPEPVGVDIYERPNLDSVELLGLSDAGYDFQWG